LNLATRVVALRAAGWRVEWQRVQFAADTVPSTGAGGYWYLVGVCVGGPQ
jgi:hypothetical protein